MTPTPVPDTHGNTRRLRRLLPDSVAACLATPNCRAIITKKHQISSSKTPAARSCFNLPSACVAKRVSLSLRAITAALERVAKSP